MQLREARIQAFLSIRELASKAGVATRTIVEIEHGRQVPTFKTARKLAEGLGVSPTDIDEFAEMMRDELEGKDAA